MGNDIKKILLVQLFSNGDCLYATAVARQIKKDFPDHKLVWAVADFCSPILLNNPFIDEVLEIRNINKNQVWETHETVMKLKKLEGKTYYKVFVTHDTFGDTKANFAGSIRSRVLKSYPYPITVPVQPILQFNDKEISNARAFFEKNNLEAFKTIILFEYAPLSSQVYMTKEIAIKISISITEQIPGTAIILSSANKINTNHYGIIDGSMLTLRETAAFTHYCHLLLGCSSGITWITTSTGAKFLPMVQLIDKDALFLNSPANDFALFNIKHNGVIELQDHSFINIVNCIKAISEFGIDSAFKIFHKPTPYNFKTTTLIVYSLLTSFKWSSLIRHWKMNVQMFGLKFDFIWAYIKGILFCPYYFVRNKIKK